MPNVVRFKAGVLPIGTLAPAGVRILGALEVTARRFGVDLTVTCADKDHPPADPHSVGRAIDVRTHDLPEDQKLLILRAMMIELADNHGMDAPFHTSGGLATMNFFGWIEHPGEANEHFHFQQRRGVNYEGAPV